MAQKVTSELLYEVLKSIQAQVGLLRDDMDNVKGRLTSIDTRLALVHTDMAHQSERLDRLEFRIDRVETRLTLTDEKQ
jgi:tetrahydromethanopterin S-methyltransferase subunit G